VDEHERVSRMNNRRPKNLARMSQRLIYGSSRNLYLRDATVLGVQQHDKHDLLVKPFHINICAENRLRITQRN
jgi:hypothetical protein